MGALWVGDGIRAVARRTVAGLIHIGEIYPLHKNVARWVREVCFG
jgi:hypothetical protein